MCPSVAERREIRVAAFAIRKCRTGGGEKKIERREAHKADHCHHRATTLRSSSELLQTSGAVEHKIKKRLIKYRYGGRREE